MKNHLDPKRTTPIGLARYAREFYVAAVATEEKMGPREITPIPVLYLSAHTIELGLKAFMLFKGVPLEELPKKKFGHDLVKCLKKADELGLKGIVSFDQVEIGAIRLLSDLYSSKQLNYIVTGSKSFPLHELVKSFCNKLLDSVCPYVGYR